MERCPGYSVTFRLSCCTAVPAGVSVQGHHAWESVFQGGLSQGSPVGSWGCKARGEAFRIIRSCPLTLPMRTSGPREIASGPGTTRCPPGFGEQGHRSVWKAGSLVTCMRAHVISLVIILDTAHVIRVAVPWEPRDLVLDLALPHRTSWSQCPPFPRFFICGVRPAEPKVPEFW